MRVAHLSTWDVGGGAARGSFGLHQALVDLDVDSWLVVERPTVDDPRVVGTDKPLARYRNAIRHRVDQAPVAFNRGREAALFSPTLVSSGVVGQVRKLQPDIVHLHWVASSFVRPEDLPRFGVPIVWTLRDMWPFTGGCHYAGDCSRYADSCGACPRLGSSNERDLSRWVWSRKSRAFPDADIVPVGISRWMSDRASESALFGDLDVRTIENAIDTDFWKPVDGQLGRDRHAIQADTVVLLFVSLSLDDQFKGFDSFAQACRWLAADQPGRFHAIVVGLAGAATDTDLGVSSTFTGRIDDDQVLRDLYSAADIAVLPSVAEAFGKTGAEALACGTPCVVFDGTGLSDVVSQHTTGYVAPMGSVEGLVSGIHWILAEPDRLTALGAAGRNEAVDRFSVPTQAQKYRDLYREVLEA